MLRLQVAWLAGDMSAKGLQEIRRKLLEVGDRRQVGIMGRPRTGTSRVSWLGSARFAVAGVSVGTSVGASVPPAEFSVGSPPSSLRPPFFYLRTDVGPETAPCRKFPTSAYSEKLEGLKVRKPMCVLVPPVVDGARALIYWHMAKAASSTVSHLLWHYHGTFVARASGRVEKG